MIGWVHFTFQTASLISLFVIRPRREALEALCRVEVFASRPEASGQGKTSFSECPPVDTQNCVHGASHV
jgi:hypothetical protein